MDETRLASRADSNGPGIKPEQALAEELCSTRAGLDRLDRIVELEGSTESGHLLAALQELRGHLRRCYRLEEAQGIRGANEPKVPTFEREERRLFGSHQRLSARLEVLLHDLREHSHEEPDLMRAAVREFLSSCRQLDLEETHFVLRSTYAEYGGGD